MSEIKEMEDEIKADGVYLKWALIYSVATEEFDRRLPGHMSKRGEWIVRGDYRAMSTAYAHKKRKSCLAGIAAEMSTETRIGEASWHKFRQTLSGLRFSHEYQIAMLESMGLTDQVTILTKRLASDGAKGEGDA